MDNSTIAVLSTFVQIFLLLAAPPLVVAALVWLIAKSKASWQEFKYFQPDIARELERGARWAVMAAEQAGLSKQIKDKKEYAITILEGYLALKGMTVDLHLIDAAIEAAVGTELKGLGTPQPDSGL